MKTRKTRKAPLEPIEVLLMIGVAVITVGIALSAIYVLNMITR